MWNTSVDKSYKSYGDWGSVFGDVVMATAISDSLLHHSTTVNIRGDRYHLEKWKKAGLLAPFERKEKGANKG